MQNRWLRSILVGAKRLQEITATKASSCRNRCGAVLKALGPGKAESSVFYEDGGKSDR